MLRNFRHACIIVSDLDRAIKFYRDILGLKLERVTEVEGEYPEKVLGVQGVKLTYVKFRAPDQSKETPPIFELHFWENPKLEIKKTYSHISFTVDGLDSEYERMRRLGVRFISEPVKAPHGHTKICFGYDPDDNLIEFVEDL